MLTLILEHMWPMRRSRVLLLASVTPPDCQSRSFSIHPNRLMNMITQQPCLAVLYFQMSCIHTCSHPNIDSISVALVFHVICVVHVIKNEIACYLGMQGDAACLTTSLHQNVIERRQHRRPNCLVQQHYRSLSSLHA